MNAEQQALAAKLTWPGFHGGEPVASGVDTTLRVNGVRVILYPSGKLDILAVEDSDYARRCEARIREELGDLILGHVRTYRAGGLQLVELVDNYEGSVYYRVATTDQAEADRLVTKGRRAGLEVRVAKASPAANAERWLDQMTAEEA